jgi:hypothetical protein
VRGSVAAGGPTTTTGNPFGFGSWAGVTKKKTNSPIRTTPTTTA